MKATMHAVILTALRQYISTCEQEADKLRREIKTHGKDFELVAGSGLYASHAAAQWEMHCVLGRQVASEFEYTFIAVPDDHADLPSPSLPDAEFPPVKLGWRKALYSFPGADWLRRNWLTLAVIAALTAVLTFATGCAGPYKAEVEDGGLLSRPEWCDAVKALTRDAKELPPPFTLEDLELRHKLAREYQDCVGEYGAEAMK